MDTEIKASKFETKVQNAIRTVIGAQGTRRRRALNFVARATYRTSNLLTDPIVFGFKKMVGKRGTKRHSFFVNTWDLILGNFGRQKAINDAQSYVVQSAWPRDRILDLELGVFSAPFEKFKHMNRVFNTVSTIGYPVAPIVTTKVAILKPSSKTISAAGYSWAKTSAICAPKIHSVWTDWKEAARDFRESFQGAVFVREDKGVKERAEKARLLFYQEMAKHNYAVDPSHLDKNNIENFDKFTRIIEEKMQYRPKIIKLGKLQIRW